MSQAELALIDDLRATVGRGHVLTRAGVMRRYCYGFRFGGGPACAVVRPGSLVQLWRVTRICVDAGAIIVPQAANTGLTGGSTPSGDNYDRPVIVVSTERLASIHLIDSARQAICLPGATLHQLEQRLAAFKREPHSVIGSSCFGASVIGGICNNSGGALIQRGPAYTEFALYAQSNADGTLCLVNTLGLDLGEDPEAILARLDAGDFTPADVRHDLQRRGSDSSYCDHVRQVDAPSPARFNADERCLSGASGSAGRVMVFAVRLDTFPAEDRPKVFYIGTNDPDELAAIRRDMLSTFRALPISAEYIHRNAFDIAARYGKDMFLIIRHLGTGRLPTLFRWKSRMDDLAEHIGIASFSDRLLQALSRLFPDHLPARMKAYRHRFEHHLLLKMSEEGASESRAYLAKRFPTASGDFFECDPGEAADAFLHRFAVAGAAVRYRAVHAHKTGGLVALDLALPRNTRDWVESLPAEIERRIACKLYYGHFFCHVFHHDYLLNKGADPLEIEHRMLDLLDKRGAECPAEHNVGHLYKAKPALESFYRKLDPRNQFNPGIGHTSRLRDWHDPAAL